MPDLKPFRPLLYDTERVALDDVVAPPYDVISPGERDRYYARHPQNVIRLILGREADPYAEAQRSLSAWRRDGILRRETNPSIYLLRQSFRDQGGAEHVRDGFIAACRIEELGAGTIFPHEKTLSKPLEDRLRLLETTGSMFSQVFLCYADAEHRVDRLLSTWRDRPPVAAASQGGVVNTIWQVTDQRTLLELQSLMESRRVTIADGHHRYETALTYARLRRIRNPRHSGKEAYNYLPVYCTNLASDGLKIFPTHRILREFDGFDPEAFLRELASRWRIRSVATPAALRECMDADHHTIGIILPGERRFFLADTGGVGVHAAAGLPPMLAGLDVSILQHDVLKGILRMTNEDLLARRYLDYDTRFETVLSRVEDGTAQAGFLLHAPPVDLVRTVAEAGLTMPQKSTYFFPKLLSGLFISLLDAEEDR